jgi:DNA-binding winged helix-turn-helix (wHTH) protein
MRRFGSFEFDSVAHRLCRDGAEIHLAPKAFELLDLLIEASPRVVSKRELHERLWPKGVVADATLVALVKQVRRALADHDRRAPLIRTVHRVGYAFDASVVDVKSRPLLGMARWLIRGDQALRLAVGDNIVGRDPRSNVWLDHPTVSRRHARIVVSENAVQLEDLGSKNETSVDGIVLSGRRALQDGNRVGFGEVFMIYRESSAGLPTVTQVNRVAGARPRL